MKDPTRLAAIKALKPTPGPWETDRNLPGLVFTREPKQKMICGCGNEVPKKELAEFFVAAADPEYGLKDLAAEVERLQEREKPPVSMTRSRGVISYACECRTFPAQSHNYCANCGRKLEWK